MKNMVRNKRKFKMKTLMLNYISIKWICSIKERKINKILLNKKFIKRNYKEIDKLKMKYQESKNLKIIF